MKLNKYGIVLCLQARELRPEGSTLGVRLGRLADRFCVHYSQGITFCY